MSMAPGLGLQIQRAGFLVGAHLAAVIVRTGAFRGQEKVRVGSNLMITSASILIRCFLYSPMPYKPGKPPEPKACRAGGDCRSSLQ